MKKTNRLIDFFAVIGPDQQFTINDPEIEQEKSITGLEIINGYFNNQIDTNKDNMEEWIDLDGTRTVWLKINFNQKYIPPITHLEFLYMPQEGEYLKIPANLECLPIPVKKHREKNEHRFGGNQGKYKLFQGNYDLTKLLDAEGRVGYNLVLCYKVQSQRNFNAPLTQLILTIGEKSKKLYKANLNQNDIQMYLPKDFKPLTITFGVPEKNRMLCYKRKTDIFKISYMPKVLDKYPDEEFPEAIAMFCFPEGLYLYQNDSPNPKAFSFILTQADGARIYGTALCFYEPIEKELYKNIGHIENNITVIGQKAICLISHFPYMNEFKKILRQLYRISLSNSELPIERYISNIVNDIRFSSEAINAGLQFDIGSDSIIFKTSSKFQYISDESLKNLFRVLDCERIIYLFECVLLERKILLISKYKSLLTQVAECLTGLIYPFVWTHVLIPILPENLKSYIDAPVPFIIGISSENKTGEDNESLKPSDNIRVYLDSCDLIFIENLPPLPEKPLAQLRKRLAPYENFHKSKSLEILENIDSAFEMAIIDSDPNEEYFNASEIRDAFFEFISSFLKDYRKFVNGLSQNKIVNTDFSEVFNIKGFLEHNKSQKQGSFIYKLTETGLFCYFVESSISVQNEIDFTFLNTALKAKREKKNPIILKIDTVNKIIACPQPNDQGLKNKKEFYKYNTFPKLSAPLYAKPLYQGESIGNEWKSLDNIGDLNSLDDSKWAKLLLESIYTIWFIIFNIKIKLEYMDCYALLTEYSISLLDDMKKRGIIPNITILRCLIEAIGYYFADKQEKLQDLVKLMNEEKIESMNLHGAYISAVSIGRSLKQKRDKAGKKIVGIEEDDDIEEKKGAFPFEKKSELKKEASNTDLSSQFDNMVLAFDDSCPHCNRVLFSEEIFSGWKKSYQEYVTTCPGCKQYFASNIKIMEILDSHQKTVPVNLFSPIVVRKELENINHHIGGKNIFSENFQNNPQHKVIFWNIYFYLTLLRLPTFILDRNQSEKFLEGNIKSMFKEMSSNKPSSKTISYQGGLNSANFNSYRFDGKMDINSMPTPPRESAIQTIISNSKSIQSTGLSNLTGPTHKMSQISQMPMSVNDKNNMANQAIKKVFGSLLKEFKLGSDYKVAQIQMKKNLDYKTY